MLDARVRLLNCILASSYIQHTVGETFKGGKEKWKRKHLAPG